MGEEEKQYVNGREIVKTKEKTISFVVPVFNDADSIEKMVYSVRDQDLPGIEIIAVNDGSTDDTKNVLDGLKESGLIDTVIHFEQNKGACIARNAGAKIAQGKYLSFLPADAILYPGMARIWYNTLEENPDYDFMYGGYRFIDEHEEPIPNHEFFFEPFDPYLLEVTNYIDGSFPIKTESFWKFANIMNQPDGLWDPNIKSLQDWDFWLSVVKNGGKGVYVQDIFFGTTLPHKGGLSDDSANNWLERTKAIKAKHNIPIRKMCVASVGAPFHGKRMAYLLGADFKEMPSFKPHEYDSIYVIGFYPELAQQQDSMFLNNMFDPKQGHTAAKKIVHFVGSDIWQLYHVPLIYLKGVWQPYFRNMVDEILCEDEFTQKELKELGIEAKVVPLPPVRLPAVRSLPKDFTVAVYMPAVNRDFYRPNEMIEVVKRLPDVKFKFFGNPGQVGLDPALPQNMEYAGYITDMDAFISECSAIIRFPIHDGLPISVLEFILAGRYAVTSVPIKGAAHIPSANPDEIAKALKAIQEGLAIEPKVNQEAADYWRGRLDHETYKKTIWDLATYHPADYWEKRSGSWITQAANSKVELEDVKEFYKEINPQSVLDVGCGDGRWVPHLMEWTPEVKYHGIDISGSLVKAAQDRFPHLSFQHSTLEGFNDSPIKYDLAFVYTCLEHITEEEFPKAVEALKRVAKKALIIEPENFTSRNYCHNHPYRETFKVIKEKKLADKTIFLVDLE